ncbi:alpha-(1,3)-fucosyltransferase C-like [Uloborus diversus]|uniref:alpha-(1,3)-fucosyltransferase C-like n=1 Tax=Uloborus diversus TaxID=327109 RepID=UPI0024098AEA|nr:alpha-(1,3)-fucosyltransferase C-like [Uloborus diversus]XP_054722488.1 alpha-(1,3)-fucosyltransferase C-like [Uloborus diversus]
MERIPALKCPPRKTLLYLFCAMFLACAFYVFYVSESYTSVHLLEDNIPNPINSPSSVQPPSTTAAEAKSAVTKSSSENATASGPTTPGPPPSDGCRTGPPKLVLLWTPFFGSWEYLGNFERCRNCRNCRITRDRNRLLESDAVVFHCRDMSLADLPPSRLPRQRWVFYCLESPAYSDFPALGHARHLFNDTMTYRADSDIAAPYGTVSKVRPPRPLDRESLKWAWSNKTRSAAWLTSNCRTDGGRDAYVRELRRHIDVDVYGKCGWLQCPQGQTHKCLLDFAAKYHFFLSFENAICRDYVTEKFYRTLQYDIVPVVFGGADYRRVAPPGSFVDALAFKSPKHLAFFLRGLAKDFKLYSSYFEWRRSYAVSASNSKQCALCARLHRGSERPSSYGDLRKWWVDEAHCKTWKPKR